MSNLVKNELTKIFHKKSLYIILIIIILLMIFSLVIDKIFEAENGFYEDNSSYIQYLKEDLKNLNKDDPEQRKMYIEILSQIQALELSNKFENDSWQKYIIDYKAQPLIYNMLINEGNKDYSKYKQEYNKFIEKLNNNDWKTFAQEELNDVNHELNELEKMKKQETIQTKKDELENQIQEFKLQKQVLDWRIEKDIAYGYKDKRNLMLDEWAHGKRELLSYDHQSRTKELSYSEKYSMQEEQEKVELIEYSISNISDKDIVLSQFMNRQNLTTAASQDLVNCYQGFSIFIIIAIVVIAGTIVSEEFNKGTIKLLLVRPYKRIRILVSKFLACLIILVLIYVVVAILQFVMGGINYGFGNYTKEIVIYNFNTKSVETIGILKYLLISGLTILPKYILIMTLAFALSTIFVNSPIAIAIPILGIMGEDIINNIAYYSKKAEFLKFFVTPNWDLSQFLFGKMPRFQPISVPFSICICIIYFIIMISASLIVFKKKEIKNI